MKLLCIEDNPGDARLVREYLGRGDPPGALQFDVASSAAAGRSALDAEQYDAVLLDLGLPDLNHDDCMAFCREIAATLPLIVLTGNDSEHLAKELIRVGVQDYVVKGAMTDRSLLRTISFCIERFGLQRELAAHRRELEAAYDRFRKLVTDNSDAVLLLDAEGGVYFRNPRAGQLLGDVKNAALLLQAPFPLHDDQNWEVVIDGQPPITVDVRLSHTLWNGADAFVATLHDITDRKEQEAEQRRAREEAERASRLKSEFLGNVSHELRTPLNGIIGMAEALLTEDFTPAQQEKLGVIAKSGATLLDLVSDLLDLTKIEAGRMDVEPKPASLAQLIADTRAAWAPQCAARGLQFSTEIAADLPDTVVIDRRRVFQILQNLLSNACKFTRHGTISLKVDRSQRDGVAMLRFTVADTGIGIPQTHRPGIFKKFFQVDASLSRGQPGTGLGLAICRELVLLLKGDIDFVSRVGEGTSFMLRVPLRLAHGAPVISEGEEPTPPPAKQASETLGRRILIAEDNEINQKVIEALLGPLQHDLTLVEDGKQALERLEREAFDLVLMDIHMPVMDGFEAVRRIRALPGERAKTPIIALTADAMDGDRRRIIAAGFDGYISKPIDRLTLWREVKASLARSS